MRLGIIVSKATSLREVGRDIAYVASKLGHTPRLVDYTANAEEIARFFDAAIIVMAANPLFLTPYALLNRDLLRLGVPSFIYTTTEGRLPRYLVQPWWRRDCKFVANSEYTRRRLEEVELPVLDMVYHGVNFEEVERAKRLVKTVRKMLETKYGDGVYYLTIASSHPRKGHDIYARVVAEAAKKCKDCKFMIVTEPKAAKLYPRMDNVIVDSNFGRRSKTEVLALIGAVDWYVQPTLAEGFGLPVLEAMSMGTPVVHLAYEPLIEFSDPDANIMVPYKDVVEETFGEGLLYELHIYDPRDMVAAIMQAYDIRVNREEEYRERSRKAEETAKNYDIMKLYKRLIEILDEVKPAK